MHELYVEIHSGSFFEFGAGDGVVLVEGVIGDVYAEDAFGENVRDFVAILDLAPGLFRQGFVGFLPFPRARVSGCLVPPPGGLSAP